MIVTPRDVVIADYAVQQLPQSARSRFSGAGVLKLSAARTEGVLLSALAAPAMGRTRAQRRTRTPRSRASASKVHSDRLEGPFEYCDPIWDRELRRIDSSRWSARWTRTSRSSGRVSLLHARSTAEHADMIGISTDYSPKEITFEPYIGRYDRVERAEPHAVLPLQAPGVRAEPGEPRLSPGNAGGRAGRPLLAGTAPPIFRSRCVTWAGDSTFSTAGFGAT